MTSIKHKTRLAALTAVLGVSVLSACSSYNSLTNRIVQRITPYRVTIVQGNFVSSEAAAKLHVGMTRDQVRSALGTPLLVDMFHPERWDYIFYFKRGSTSVVEQRDLIVNFNGDTLASWSGAEDLPSNLDLIAMIDGDRRETNLLKQKTASKADTRTALTLDANGKPIAPAAASGSAAAASSTSSPVAESGMPASGVVAPNQQAADAANRALAAPSTSTRQRAPNVPQSAVVHGGPPSAVQAAPEPAFHFTAPSHLRPAGGSSLLAQPPSMDNAAPSNAASGTTGQ